MTTAFEHVRLIVGIAHGVDGARLDVHTGDGEHLRVHDGPGADLDMCSMRRSVIGSARLGRPDAAWADTTFELGGRLESIAGDLYRVKDPGHAEHWFATLMHPGHVFDRIESLDADPEASARVFVTLKPDPGLGITLVSVSAHTGGTEADVAEAARMAHAACVVDELIFDTRSLLPAADRGSHAVGDKERDA